MKGKGKEREVENGNGASLMAREAMKGEMVNGEQGGKRGRWIT